MGDWIPVLNSVLLFATALLTFWNNRKIEQVHRATNSMKDELVREVKQASHAEGLKEGREEPRLSR